MIVPVLVVLYFVAVWVVDSHEFLADLLPVRSRPSLHLVGADMQLPSGTSAPDPAVGARVFEREAGFRHVVGVTDVDDRVAVWVLLGIGVVHGGKTCWPLGGRPTAEDP